MKTNLFELYEIVKLIDEEMAEKFYSVALCVLAAVLIRWCVSISSYSGNFPRKKLSNFSRLEYSFLSEV